LGALALCLYLRFLAACSTSEPAATGPSGAAPGDGRVVVTEADYSRAESLLSWNLQDKVLRSDIRPNWIDDDRFWYRVRTSNGFRFYRVDPDARERSHAFNHERLAGALGEAAGRTISPAGDLTFTTFRYIHDETAILFRAHEKNWECDLGGVCLQGVGASGAAGQQRVVAGRQVGGVHSRPQPVGA
jgi:hypothetical protein